MKGHNPKQSEKLFSPDPALVALTADAQGQSVALLHSGRRSAPWSERSWLGMPAFWYVCQPDGVGRLVGSDLPISGSLWQDLRWLLNHPDLPGTWIGYFSYELCHLIEPAKLPEDRRRDERHLPRVSLGYCPQLQPIEAGGSVPAGRAYQAGEAHSCYSRADYEQAVARVIDYIGAGDVFQVNLSHRLSGRFRGSARDLFLGLVDASPAWYGAYLELPDGRVVLSTSPELFLQVARGRVLTRPIKGTRPAHVCASELAESLKDQAELNMIVDLMRNDLGRVCRLGSVRVVGRREVESHPTVHHGVATIQGDLLESCDLVDLLQATLPAGSVTGAPKVRAMQIIQELEPVTRGVYCGAIGWLRRDAMMLNVAIRTMVVDPAAGWFDVHVGGGVVADSTPAGEYQETLDKARAMLRALQAGDLGK